MSISRHLRDFDHGIQDALRNRELASRADRLPLSMERFASFCFYDANGTDFACVGVSQKESPTQPLLWKHLHNSLQAILREDSDTKSTYAGFATLFTLDRESRSPGGRASYFSMAVDVDLSKPGFKDGLPLTNWQFNSSDPNRPLGVTSICLNADMLDQGYCTKPVIFYWKPRNAPEPDGWGKAPDALASWTHIFVSADIKEDPHTGLAKPSDWTLDFSEFIFADKDEELTKSEAINRLQNFLGTGGTRSSISPVEGKALLNRLAWTITYFAYGCKCLETTLRPNQPFPFDHLAIVCAPASFEPVVSAALYVPFFGRPGEEALQRAAIKTLFLARALGMPLESLQEFQTGRAQSQGDFAHQTSAVIGSIAQHICRLPESVLQEIGGHCLALIYLLREAINSYREQPSDIDRGEFPGLWKASDCPLIFYTDVALQLGLARAQDGPEDETEVRAIGRSTKYYLNRPGQSGFAELKDRYFAIIPNSDLCLRPYLKKTTFAVLLLLALKQAVYHTIRASCKGSRSKIILSISVKLHEFSVRIENPAIPGEVDKISKDSRQLALIASRLSGLGDPAIRYCVVGPEIQKTSGSWFIVIIARHESIAT